ncbi:MAG: hypothetical protein L0332_20190 [Chloroflexi bacterium]|nr:hypothetical protein [Chloroflexota bacterium]MCI0577000.1 hypothetical protein [Chloroflexota bacterium]MCI0647779.1 hypothetical protein [Chloroflexota bacterium]MCI0729019.1 hypothetical protein [Chloroflexota bacterium]
MSTQLLEPILAGGVRNTHFFNGRLLTAEAMRAEQEANRRQRQQLGQATGHGVVSGLAVEPPTLTAGPAVVHVTAGLALNRLGQAVALAGDVDLALTPATITTPVEAGLFTDCGVSGPTGSQSPAGVYILVVAPASGFEGKAPLHGLTDQGAANGCGNRYAVEGVRFKLVGLDINSLTGISTTTRSQLATLLATDDDDPARLSRLRNLLAHLCFGTEEVAGFAVDPFRRTGGVSAFVRYGAVDALNLDDCDVPLALIHLTTRGVRLIDNWAVRRRVAPAAPSALWPTVVGERRLAEAEAVFLQFQDHIRKLIQDNPGTAGTLVATNYFRYLPPAGLLQVNAGSLPGITVSAFFSGTLYQDPQGIEGAQLPALLRATFNYPPVDLTQGEALWLYQVRENDLAVTGGQAVQPYVVFTTGHLPLLGDGRFDMSRWNYFHFT